MGALIERPAHSAPFRDNRGGGGLSRKGAPVPVPSPFPFCSVHPPFRHKPSAPVIMVFRSLAYIFSILLLRHFARHLNWAWFYHHITYTDNIGAIQLFKQRKLRVTTLSFSFKRTSSRVPHNVNQYNKEEQGVIEWKSPCRRAAVGGGGGNLISSLYMKNIIKFSIGN